MPKTTQGQGEKMDHTSDSKPTKHAPDCEYHVDQYESECTCEHCDDCGALVDGQGYSIDEHCCYRCSGK